MARRIGKVTGRSGVHAFIGATLSFCLALTAFLPSPAEVLKGRVEHEDELLRIDRPRSAGPTGAVAAPDKTTRIARPAAGFNGTAGRANLDTTAFAPPLTGKINDFDLGIARSDTFKSPPPKNFDLGAERNSKEMVLAWERWHKQLSEAIYRRWSNVADSPGQATVRVTVARNRTIRAQIITSTGDAKFNHDLMRSINGLNGNSGLEFPAKSQRQQVSFEADYIAAHNVRPGYSWVKNDYERVREDW